MLSHPSACQQRSPIRKRRGRGRPEMSYSVPLRGACTRLTSRLGRSRTQTCPIRSHSTRSHPAPITQAAPLPRPVLCTRPDTCKEPLWVEGPERSGASKALMHHSEPLNVAPRRPTGAWCPGGNATLDPQRTRSEWMDLEAAEETVSPCIPEATTKFRSPAPSGVPVRIRPPPRPSRRRAPKPSARHVHHTRPSARPTPLLPSPTRVVPGPQATRISERHS